MFSISLVLDPIFTCPICLDDTSSGIILNCQHRFCHSCFDNLVYLKDFAYEVGGEYPINCSVCRQPSNLSCDEVASSAYRRNKKYIGRKEAPIVINDVDDDMGIIIFQTFRNFEKQYNGYSSEEDTIEGVEEMEDDDDDDDDDYEPEEDSLWEQFDE